MLPESPNIFQSEGESAYVKKLVYFIYVCYNQIIR